MSDLSDKGAVLLNGRYEPLEVLGSGSEARVVKGIDKLHSRLVALKIRPAGSGDAGRAELLAEAGLLLGLAPHPSLPLVRDDFFNDDQYVVVMDWVDGTDLARLVRDQGTPGLAVSSVLAYLADAAEALTFLHTQSPPIVHADVKPENLILTRGGRVKLVNFGLSCRLDGEPRPRGASGLFEAPELRAGGSPSRAGDVYSLAATAYALLTGEPPTAELRDIVGVDVAQGLRLTEAIRTGLEADPSRRPDTPGELIERMRAGWASTLPAGVLTFCMSDIEGSTELWESYPGPVAEAVVRHDELIAGIVEAHQGRFLKAMGEGDSTTSVFTSATKAARAAIEANRALAEERWPGGVALRVRFGLHTGESEQRGGVYLGTTVNLAARVRSAARGCEVLLSRTTAWLIRDDLPSGYAVVDLGPHRLKGIERPEPISAITGPYLVTPPSAAECPYRGLLAFGADDRNFFFGREEVVREALERIARGRLLAVVGASGSGKSSLLGAGVLAAVQAGELPFLQSARLISPGPDPPLELGGDASELLVVDQFEELYTQCRDAERRERFIAALLSRDGPVVIGVRADFYGEMSAHRDLIAAVSGNQVPLGPMSGEDLRRAIAEPTRVAGLELEPGLLDLVLRDVAGEPGGLPLMSHALRETWERRNGRTLTVAAYQDTGGVASALAKTADAVVARTREADRPLLRGIFLRLTEIGEDAEETRRRVPIEELVPQGAPPGTVRALLERLAEARLVTLGEGGTAEVAHEVLIRRWPKLRRWLEEDRDGIRLHRRLGDAARLWDRAGREVADLYRGTRLDAAVEWAKANSELLNQTEREFIDASVSEAAGAHRRQARVNRRLRYALTASAGLLLVALALLVFALVSRHSAVRAGASARSRSLASEAESQIGRDPQRALLIARSALKVAPTAEAELAVSDALDANTVRSQLPSFGVQPCVTSNYMFLLNRGRTAVDNTCDGSVVFADLASKRITRRVHVGRQSTLMTLGPNARSLIVASGRYLSSVNVRSGHTQRVLTAPFPVEQGDARAGRYFAITDAVTVAVADVARRRVRIVAHGDSSANNVVTLAWASPSIVLIGTSGQSRGHGDLAPGVTELDLVSGVRHSVPLPVAPHHFTSVTFMVVSADGRTWYVSGNDVDARSKEQVGSLWAIDARSHRTRWVVHGPVGAASEVYPASPDGRLITVGYSEGEIDVLDAATGRLVIRNASSSSVTAGWALFPPGDGSLVTVSLDGVFRTWSVRGGEQLRLQAPADPALDFTPGGNDLVLLGDRGSFVDRRTGQTVRTYPGFPATGVFNFCSSACFAATPGLRRLTYLDPTSATPRIVEIDGQTGRRLTAIEVSRLDAQGVAPDGRIVADYVDDGRLHARVFDPLTGRGRDLQPGQSSNGCGGTTPAFSADGRLMAIVDGCLHVVVWDLQSGRVVHTEVLPTPANASSAPAGATTANGARMSPDGRYVLVAVEGGGLVRFDLRTGGYIELPGTRTVANALAISTNGRFYAIGRQDGTADVYDARSLRLIRHHTLEIPIQTLAFSPDSRELAVEDANHVVWVWDTCDICENASRLAQVASNEIVRQLTPSERATFGIPHS